MAMTSRKTWTASGQAPQKAAEANAAAKAFESDFLEHWPRVYGLLLRMLGSHDEAEDLALETFLRLYQRPPSKSLGRQPENTAGWLYRVATNLGLNAIRGWKRRQRYEMEAGMAGVREQRDDSPAEIFAAEEEHRRVRQALGQMAPRQAQLLVLRHSGLSYQEVAAALDLSPASIGPLLLRAEHEFERHYTALDELPGEAGRMEEKE